MTNYEIGKLCGWLQRPDEVELYVGSLPTPTFADAAPHLAGTGEGSDVCYWDFEDKVIGRVLRSFHQQIGSCVGQGYARAAQDLMLIEIANGEPEEIPEDVLSGMDDGVSGFVAVEPIYGGSRCEVGGQWGSRSDGSVGAWAAKWVSEWGVILRKKYDFGGTSIDLSRHSPSRCKEYGARGCPDDLEPVAKEHPVRSVTQVTTYEQVRDMLANGYPVPVASSQGFTMKRRAGGWCDPRGTWMHQMLFRGHLVTKGNRPGVVVQNSWGGYLGTANNRVQLESGREVVLPEGCFLAEPDVVTRMARQNDTFALSGFTGFPERIETINWVFGSKA